MRPVLTAGADDPDAAPIEQPGPSRARAALAARRLRAGRRRRSGSSSRGSRRSAPASPSPPRSPGAAREAAVCGDRGARRGALLRRARLGAAAGEAGPHARAAPGPPAAGASTAAPAAGVLDGRPARAAAGRRHYAPRAAPPRRSQLDVGAAVAGADQDQRQHEPERRDHRAADEGRLEALGERVGQLRGRPASPSRHPCASWRSSPGRRGPSAPPICCEVLISPLARPDSRSSTPETAAIVEVTKAKPRPDRQQQRRPEDVGEEAAAHRDLAEPDAGRPR